MTFHEFALAAVVDPRDLCDLSEHWAAELALLPNDEVGPPLEHWLPILEQRGG